MENRGFLATIWYYISFQWLNSAEEEDVVRTTSSATQTDISSIMEEVLGYEQKNIMVWLIGKEWEDKFVSACEPEIRARVKVGEMDFKNLTGENVKGILLAAKDGWLNDPNRVENQQFEKKSAVVNEEISSAFSEAPSEETQVPNIQGDWHVEFEIESKEPIPSIENAVSLLKSEFHKYNDLETEFHENGLETSLANITVKDNVISAHGKCDQATGRKLIKSFKTMLFRSGVTSGRNAWIK